MRNFLIFNSGHKGRTLKARKGQKINVGTLWRAAFNAII